jgi:hypothetical protein
MRARQQLLLAAQIPLGVSARPLVARPGSMQGKEYCIRNAHLFSWGMCPDYWHEDCGNPSLLLQKVRGVSLTKRMT